MLMRAATVVQQLCKLQDLFYVLYCMFYFTCDRSFTARSTVGCELGVSENWVRIGALEKESLETLPEDRQRRC